MSYDIADDLPAAAPMTAVSGMQFHALTASAVIHQVQRELTAGRGGQIVTPNVQIIRQMRRTVHARRRPCSSSLVLADGAPIVWASRLAGEGLPERVAGGDLLWRLCATAAEDGRRVFLLGGAADSRHFTASLAAQHLCETFPRLHVVGACSPPVGFESDPCAMTSLESELSAADPHLVFVGFGFFQQERLIANLSKILPNTWFFGCGGAIDFAADMHRATPLWMRKVRLGWLHRLLVRSRRRWAPYMVSGIPTVARMLTAAAWRRLRTRRNA